MKASSKPMTAARVYVLLCDLRFETFLSFLFCVVGFGGPVVALHVATTTPGAKAREA
jgi:hypothetical protein